MRPNVAAGGRLMHDASIAMSELEHVGVRLDMGYVHSQIKKVTEEIASIEKRLKGTKVFGDWQRRFGVKANLGSRDQLGKLIFDHYGHKRALGVAKKVRSDDHDGTKRQGKNDEAAFQDVPLKFIKHYFRMEKLKKLKSTYLDGLVREQIDGRVHPYFNLNRVISQRTSSSMPNFQNVPARNKVIAEIIRRCYVPEPGQHFVEIDYAQMEVRVSACYNHDPALIKYIKDPTTDMHRDLAMKLFFMDEDTVKKLKKTDADVRDFAKNRMTFPEFYGSVYFQCAANLWAGVMKGGLLPDGVTTLPEHMARNGVKSLGDCGAGADLVKGTFVHHVKQAESYLWDEMFPVYTQWKHDTYARYLRKGHFDLHTGFRIEGLFKRNDVLNYAIQGSSAHCILQAIVWILQEMKRRRMRARLVGQIHDSLQASVPPDELQDFLTLCHEMMVARLAKEWKWIIIPVEIEAEVSPLDESWHMKKVWANKGGLWQAA